MLMNFAVFASKLLRIFTDNFNAGKGEMKVYKMFHLSKAKDAQNQDFDDISGENQRLSASENRVAMENQN